MQQSFFECVGTLLAISGIAFSISVFALIALPFLDRFHRWF